MHQNRYCCCYKKSNVVIFTLHNYILIRKIMRHSAKLKLSARVLQPSRHNRKTIGADKKRYKRQLHGVSGDNPLAQMEESGSSCLLFLYFFNYYYSCLMLPPDKL